MKKEAVGSIQPIKKSNNNLIFAIIAIVILLILLFALAYLGYNYFFQKIEPNQTLPNQTYVNDTSPSNGSKINDTLKPINLCGNGKCDKGENYTNCAKDCRRPGTSPDDGPSNPPCTPNCTGKSCGNDGCGGSCQPGCGVGYECNSTGNCAQLINCTLDSNCSYITGVCGKGLCNQTSNQCYSSYNLSTVLCRNNISECDAAEMCTGSSVSCSDDLNKSNGAACTGGNCQNGKCVSTCFPQCSGKQCGSNGCGTGTCPPGCPTGQYCSSTGQCIISPYKWENGPSSDPNFFPIGVWVQVPDNIDEFRNMGINIFVGLWNAVDEPQLSKFKAKNMPVIPSQNTLGITSENSSIIKGWLSMDEPDCAQWNATKGGYDACISPLIVQQKNNDIKSNDSTRPVYLNFGPGVGKEDWNGRGAECFGRLDMYPEYMKGADIVSFDLYPVASGFLFSELADGVERLVNWSNGTKIVWNIIETTHINNPSTRPTADQIKSEVWMSIIHGSMGITYFVHEWQPSVREDGIFRYPEIVGNVTLINQRITSLAPVLNSPTLQGGDSVVTNDTSVKIKTMLKEYDDSTYLFAVAMGERSVIANFTINNIATGIGEVIDENRNINILGNKFQDKFKPYEVHIYKISESVVTECLSSNNCFYVSVTGAGIRDGTVGNEMNLNDAISYANANSGKSLTFMLEDGKYGPLTLNGNSRTGSVTYKSVNSRKAVFDKLTIGKSGAVVNQQLTLDGISVIVDPAVKPTPTGDFIGGYSFGSIDNSAEIIITNSYFKGFDKYVVNGLILTNTNKIRLINNEAKTFLGNFPQVLASNSTYIINNTLNDISMGSIIRILENCNNIIIKENKIFNCNEDRTDLYFPYLIADDIAKYHMGSIFSMRSDDYTLDGNIVHDCHIAQNLMNYDGGDFSNITFQNNLFYDAPNTRILFLEPTNERPVIIRNNTFIGYININGTANQYQIMQRYVSHLEIGLKNNGEGFYFDNNIVTGYWPLPDIDNPDVKIQQDNNVFYSYNDIGKYERRGQNSIFATWQNTAFHGYPNFFEDINYRGSTPEYSYSTNGITPFFVNPGLFLMDMNWGAVGTYDAGAFVKYASNGKYYKSLQSSNHNNIPPTSSAWWAEENPSSFWDKDIGKYDLDFHPLINSVICNGGYLYGQRLITNAVKGTPSAGALPCVCTQNAQCVEVYGAGSVCNLQTKKCEGGTPQMQSELTISQTKPEPPSESGIWSFVKFIFTGKVIKEITGYFLK